MPLPEHGFSSKRIDREAKSFLVVGSTTRADVLLHLGAPDRRDGERWYSYETSYTWAAVGLLVAGGDLRSNYFLTIHFDDGGRVERVESNIK